MNPPEWALLVAQMRAYWPGAERWQKVTLDAYFEDLQEFPSLEVADALIEVRRSGRTTPPNAGILRKALLVRRSELGITQGSTVTATCTCHISWQDCERSAAGPRHTPGWFDRRREESAAYRVVETAAVLGQEVDPHAYPGMSPTELSIASLAYATAQIEASRPTGPIELRYLANVAAGMTPREALRAAIKGTPMADAVDPLLRGVPSA